MLLQCSAPTLPECNEVQTLVIKPKKNLVGSIFGLRKIIGSVFAVIFLQYLNVTWA